MRISDWSSDVCSSDLYNVAYPDPDGFNDTIPYRLQFGAQTGNGNPIVNSDNWQFGIYLQDDWEVTDRSEEHTSELQSLMRISYAVFCLKKKHRTNTNNNTQDPNTINSIEHLHT